QSETEAEGKPKARSGEELDSHYQWVMPGYFNAIGVPLVRGRALAATDRDTVAVVGVINETFAKRVYGSEDPIGRRVRGGPKERWSRSSAWCAISTITACRSRLAPRSIIRTRRIRSSRKRWRSAPDSPIRC